MISDLIPHHLYLFLILASDRFGLSFYSYDSICSLLQMRIDQYIKARDNLIEKDLIAFNGTLCQVLELPAKPIRNFSIGTGGQLGCKERSGGHS
jgi:hypothetical protein